MNDLISRQEAIDLFPNDTLEWDTNYGYVAPHFARRMIEGLSSAQPEIIRCKDCKHCRNYCRIVEDVESKYACELKDESGYPYGRFRVHEDDYCSRAERKEE